MHLLAIMCLSALTQVFCQPTIRNALLCSARERLNLWYEGGAKRTGPAYHRDGVELHFLEGDDICAGDATPIMFANFSLVGVRPIHVFNAVADIERQQEWYSGLRSAKVLKDASFHVREAKLQYNAGPGIADRFVHEWEAYDKKTDGSEYWFVASTRHNDAIAALDRTGDVPEIEDLFDWNEPVEAQNCLSAHHIRATPQGVYVVFTNQVNGHPPLGIPQDFVSKLTWGKTVDFVDVLKKRALQLAAQDHTKLWQPPPNMLPEQNSNATEKCEPMWERLRSSLRLGESLQGKHELVDAVVVHVSRLTDQQSMFLIGTCILVSMSLSIAVATRFQALRTRISGSEDARNTQAPLDGFMAHEPLVSGQCLLESEGNA